MKHIPGDWTIKQNNLKKLLSKEETFNDGIKLLLDIWHITRIEDIVANIIIGTNNDANNKAPNIAFK